MQELYYRHLYSRESSKVSAKQEILTTADRRTSWENYQALFSIIQQRNVNIQLPNVWLWDMIDEFLYQFQSYAQFKSRLSALGPDDLQFLRANPGVWDSAEVLALLTQFVEKSNIRAELSADNGKQIFETEGACLFICALALGVSMTLSWKDVRVSYIAHVSCVCIKRKNIL